MVSAPAPLPLAAVGFSPAAGLRDASVCQLEEQGQPSDFRGHAIADPMPAISKKIVRLKRRPEFLAVAASGRRWVAPAFILQAAPRSTTDTFPSGDIGIGFTATKRIGNAVRRNRAKRRLREAARLLAGDKVVTDHNYVLVARSEVLTCAFQTILSDLETAFSRVLTVKPRPPARRGRGRR